MIKYFYFLILFIGISCSNPEKKDGKILDSIRLELNLSKGSSENDIEKEIDKRLKGSYIDKKPDDIKKILAISEKLSYKKGIVNANSKLIQFYINNLDYQKALALANETEKLAKELNDNELISFNYVLRAKIYAQLNFENERLKDIKRALEYAREIKDNNARHYNIFNVYHSLTSYYERKKMPDSLFFYLNKQLPELKQMSESKDSAQNTSKYKAMLMAYVSLGDFYTGLQKPPRLDLAGPFFSKALEYKEKHPEIFEKYDREVLISAGRFYVENGEYQKAIDVSRAAWKIEKSKKSQQHRLWIFINLANAYEELNVPDSTAKYSVQFSLLNDSITHMQARGAANQVTQAVSNKAKEKDIERKSSVRGLVLIFSGIMLVLLVLGWYFWKRDQRIKYAKYEKIISQLNNQEKTEVQDVEEDGNEDVSKGERNINIHDETVTAILQKLNRFEKSQKFLKKDVTLSSLSTSLETNPRYLSEIIKQYNGKNFNNYLNGLRIQSITQLLYKEPVYREYKITYLAEYSGFASTKVFATAFKKETGVTPSYFIHQLKSEV